VIDPMWAWTADIRGRQSRLGYLLALVALCLQLAAPMLPAPQVSAATRDDFAAFLRLHALCLGGDAAQTRPEAPLQDRSDRTSHHVGACCFLHGGASSFLAPPSTGEPIAFAFSRVTFSAQAIPGVAVYSTPAPRARAPPNEA
jgi:hypothetical protein